ncbi:hypothetical protein [Massilia sp. TSP1-1-2]|uniref:hypothetical protein n=1 Tax=unclassified Massilia TaxID=2609279 RepID=UPI003CF1889E
MIFAADTDDRSLHVFPDALTAASYCEGSAVEATMWLFWDEHGHALGAQFDIPNKRGLFTTKNGVYHLVPASDSDHATLREALEGVQQVIGEFTSVEAVREYLDRLVQAGGA